MKEKLECKKCECLETKIVGLEKKLESIPVLEEVKYERVPGGTAIKLSTYDGKSSWQDPISDRS